MTLALKNIWFIFSTELTSQLLISLIKISPVLERIAHICHRRGIPVADVAVSGIGLRLIIKPQD